MQIFLILICVSFLIYFIFEKLINDKRRKRINTIIHVNGTRGKSTVSRLIDAGLREAGFRVFTKITGTSPRIIDTYNSEKEILRKGKANIREQIETIKWAEKESAEILVLECMAVNPELQRVSEENILNANITVITNVRYDHLDEMGNNLEEIASSLAKTICKNGKIFTADKKFFNFFSMKAKEKSSICFLTDDIKEEYEIVDFPENVALALDVCQSLGLSKRIAFEGMKKYKKDSGVLKIFEKIINNNKLYFINAMAANDPISTEIIMNKIKKEACWENKRILLLNNRSDRVNRGKQYVNFIKKVKNEFDKIIIYGDKKTLLKRYFLKEKIDCEKICIEKNEKFLKKINDDTLILAIGNICNHGKKLLDFFELEGES